MLAAETHKHTNKTKKGKNDRNIQQQRSLRSVYRYGISKQQQQTKVKKIVPSTVNKELSNCSDSRMNRMSMPMYLVDKGRGQYIHLRWVYIELRTPFLSLIQRSRLSLKSPTTMFKHQGCKNWVTHATAVHDRSGSAPDLLGFTSLMWSIHRRTFWKDTAFVMSNTKKIPCSTATRK